MATLVAVLAVGVALRSLTLWQSPLPFNPDGLNHARNAQRAVRTGRFPLSIMATDDLAFAALLATVQSITGVRAVQISQPLIAVVGTVPALVAGGVAARTSRRLGLPARRARFAGVLAATLLAVEGFYLYRSMPVDEQTPGLSLLAIAVLAIVAAVWTSDRRWLLVALPPVLVLPPLHNLESFVLGITSLVLVGLATVSRARERLRTGWSVAIALAFWAYFAVYNVGLATLTPAEIIQSGRLTAAPDLLLAWVILSLCALAVVPRLHPWSKRTLLGTPFVILFVLLALNTLGPVFPGTPTTTTGILLPAVGLLVPIGAAVWVVPSLGRALDTEATVLALLAGPLVLIGFALSAALTPQYLDTAMRTHWFLHLPVLALAAVACAVGFGHQLATRQAVRTVAVCMLVLAVLVSLPVAFAGLSVHPYKGVTTTGELSASTFAQEHVAGQWTSDNHLVRITDYRSASVNASERTLYEWVHNPESPPPDCPVITKSSWTTVGAQFFPRPPATVAPDRLHALHADSNRIYDGGSTQSLTIVVPTEYAGAGC